MKTFSKVFCLIVTAAIAGCGKDLVDLTPVYEYPPAGHKKPDFAIASEWQTTLKADLITTGNGPLLIFSTPADGNEDSSTLASAKVNEAAISIGSTRVVSHKGVGFVAAAPFNDGVVALGETHQIINPFSGTTFDGFTLVRLNSDGDMVWQSRVSEIETNYKPRFVQADAGGSFIYVEGHVATASGDSVIVHQFDADGNLRWRTSIGVLQQSIFAGGTTENGAGLVLLIAAFQRTGCDPGEYGLTLESFDSGGNYLGMNTPALFGKFEDHAFSSDDQYLYFASRLQGEDSIAFLRINQSNGVEEPFLKLPFSASGVTLTGLTVDRNIDNILLSGAIARAPDFNQQMWLAYLDAGNGYDSLRTFTFGDLEEEICRSVRIGAGGRVSVAGSTGTGTSISPLALFFDLNP